MSRANPAPKLSLVLVLALTACADKHRATQASDPASGGGRAASASAGDAYGNATGAGRSAPVSSGQIRTGGQDPDADPAMAGSGAGAAASGGAGAGVAAIGGAGAAAIGGSAGIGGSSPSAGAGGDDAPVDDPGWSSFCGEFPRELLEVAEAGSGTISGCAPRTCASPKLPALTDSAAVEALQRPDAPAPDLNGFAGCTTIEGDLLINGAVGGDLSPLRCLERVTGTVLIWYNPTLRSLDGLDSLALVDGDLLLGGPYGQLYAPNNELARIDALSALRAVRGTLAIGGDALTSLHGLEGLRATGRSLKISIVRGLSDLRGLGGLRVVGADLELWRAEGPRTLAGFDALTTVYSAFRLSGAIDLVSIAGLPELTCVGDIFDIGGSEYAYTNDRLVMADGFPKLERIGGDAVIGSHPVLESATLLGRVEYIGGNLEVRGCPQLTAVEFSALQHVGAISFLDNPVLDDCPLHAIADPLVANGSAAVARIYNNRSCPASQVCIVGECGFF